MLELGTQTIVEGTLWALEAASVVTWALILIKGFQHFKIGFYNKRFFQDFWRAPNLQAASELENEKGPLSRVANIGFATLINTRTGANTHDLEDLWDRQELLDRRLRQRIHKEKNALESGLAVLATIGSISPFVGLFGTVWGIMGALTNISKSGSASLEVVAGPIGEALVATAVGIAVAVPAVVGYNFFVRRNKVQLAYLDDFVTDFVHLALKTGFILEKNEHTATVNRATDKLKPAAQVLNLATEAHA